MEISDKTQIQKCTNDLIDCKTNILKILAETEDTSNLSTNTLNAQTEMLNKIDDKLDVIHEKLTISDKIVRSMMGFFTFFPKKIFKMGQKNDIRIEKTTKNINNVIIENCGHKDPYYDEVQGYLERLKDQALNQKEIICMHNATIDKITKKTDNSMQNIKIIESNMRKI